MSANLKQDIEPVRVNGTLHGALGLWGQRFQCRETIRSGSDPGRQHRDLRAYDAFPLGKEAERAGTQEDPASLTALSTCPLKMAPFCYAERGA